MYRGAAYADSLQYQHCINLWKYALELRVAKDSILFCDTCFTAQVNNVGLLIVNFVTCSHACVTENYQCSEVHNMSMTCIKPVL